MRGINYLAALGTVLIFISIYSFKAAFYKRAFKEEDALVKQPPGKSYSKILLLLISVFSMLTGVLLIAKALKMI